MMPAILATEMTPDLGDVLLILNLVLIIVFLVIAYIDAIEACVIRLLKLFGSSVRLARFKLWR
jgi:hypothetical protein